MLQDLLQRASAEHVLLHEKLTEFLPLRLASLFRKELCEEGEVSLRTRKGRLCSLHSAQRASIRDQQIYEELLFTCFPKSSDVSFAVGPNGISLFLQKTWSLPESLSLEDLVIDDFRATCSIFIYLPHPKEYEEALYAAGSLRDEKGSWEQKTLSCAVS